MPIPVLSHSFSYQKYHELVEELALHHRTSGTEQLPERVEATQLNIVRMRRLDKQIEVHPSLLELLGKLTRKLTWIVLTESWCGDGAQNIPVIAKIADQNKNIDLKIIFRDEHTELMDHYLTNGARAVPKLICFDSTTGEELGIWGARPAKIQAMVKEFKSANPNISHDELVKNIHLWYAKDKGQSLQEDFIPLLKSWL